MKILFLKPFYVIEEDTDMMIHCEASVILTYWMLWLERILAISGICNVQSEIFQCLSGVPLPLRVYHRIIISLL